MAIKLEFINIIVPIENIRRCASIGGFAGYLEIEGGSIGETVWYDKYLVREGVMNPTNIEDIVNEWAARGLSPIKESKSGKIWKDLCVIDSLNGLTLPCGWLAYDLEKQTAWLKDKPQGAVIGRASGEHGGVPFSPSR